MLKNLFLIAMILGTLSSLGQSSVDYRPKHLLATLQKAGVPSAAAIHEISLPDSLKARQATTGKFFKIENNSSYKYIYVGRVNSCRAGGCSIASGAAPTEENEFFDYYILFDADKTVQLVKIFRYQATHGQEVTAKGWLKQFVGYNGAESLQVNKNIDAISGATISVYAITRDVQLRTQMLKRSL